MLPHSRKGFAVLSRAREDTRTARIAHSASLQNLPSPFTFTLNRLKINLLRVKEKAVLTLHR